MGSSFAQALAIMLLIASMVTVSTANKDWQFGNYTGWGFNHGPDHLNKTRGPSKIIVGGSENWHFGFNYTEWAFKNGPFYIKDTLVFKYDPPNDTTRPHSVYMFRDFWSFLRCDLGQARMVANQTQGGGEGYEIVLKRWQPYFFACGERNGFHCDKGLMKFSFMPMFRGWNY